MGAVLEGTVPYPVHKVYGLLGGTVKLVEYLRLAKDDVGKTHEGQVVGCVVNILPGVEELVLLGICLPKFVHQDVSLSVDSVILVHGACFGHIRRRAEISFIRRVDILVLGYLQHSETFIGRIKQPGHFQRLVNISPSHIVLPAGELETKVPRAGRKGSACADGEDQLIVVDGGLVGGVKHVPYCRLKGIYASFQGKNLVDLRKCVIPKAVGVFPVLAGTAGLAHIQACQITVCGAVSGTSGVKV